MLSCSSRPQPAPPSPSLPLPTPLHAPLHPCSALNKAIAYAAAKQQIRQLRDAAKSAAGSADDVEALAPAPPAGKIKAGRAKAPAKAPAGARSPRARRSRELLARAGPGQEGS